MLFKILKLFGLDVPAEIEAAKARLEQRLELATHHVSQVAQEAALIAAFSAFAAITGMMAISVGLMGLYLFVADQYGVYRGLGAVGAFLVVVTVALLVGAVIKGKSLSPDSKLRSHATEPMSVEAVATAIPAHRSWTEPAIAVAPPASATDLVEPLAFFLSRVVKYPTLGNPLLDKMLVNLRATARGTLDDAIDRAAHVIRNGDRTNLVVVLSGAALAGWLLGRQARQ